MNRNAKLERLALEVRRASGPTAMWVVLIILGAAVGVGIVKNLTSEKPWEHYNKYRVAFDDVKGVVPGRTELRLAGVRAGSIDKSQLVDGRPVLTVSLDHKYAPLYRDAKVTIRPNTPLEDMYVDITSRGTPAAGDLGAKDILAASQTSAPVEVGRVLDVFDPNTRARLSSLLQELARGTADHGKDLRAAFVQMAPFLDTARRMSTALASRHVELARLVHNFAGLSGALAQRDTALRHFVESGQQTVTDLASNDVAFGRTVGELPPLLDRMRSSFAELSTTEDHLDPTLRALQPTADAMPDGLDALKRFSTDAIPAFTALRAPVGHLRPLAKALVPTSRGLSRALRPLVAEAPQIDRSTRLAVPCLPEVGTFLSRLMSTTKWGDSGVYAANVRVDLQQGVATAEPLPDPNWHITPPCFTKQPAGAATRSTR